MLTSTFTTYFMSWSVGDPYNPAILPNGLTGYSQTMNFQERFINTIVTFIFWVVRFCYTVK